MILGSGVSFLGFGVRWLVSRPSFMRFRSAVGEFIRRLKGE